MKLYEISNSEDKSSINDFKRMIKIFNKRKEKIISLVREANIREFEELKMEIKIPKDIDAQFNEGYFNKMSKYDVVNTLNNIRINKNIYNLNENLMGSIGEAIKQSRKTYIKIGISLAAIFNSRTGG